MLNDVLPHVEERDCTHELVDAYWDADREQVIVQFRSFEDGTEQKVDGMDVLSTGDATHRRFARGKYMYDCDVPDHVADEPHWLPLHHPKRSKSIVVRMGASVACEIVRE